MSYEAIKHWNSQFDETGFRCPTHDPSYFNVDQYGQAVEDCRTIRNKQAFRTVTPVHVDPRYFDGYRYGRNDG